MIDYWQTCGTETDQLVLRKQGALNAINMFKGEAFVCFFFSFFSSFSFSSFFLSFTLSPTFLFLCFDYFCCSWYIHLNLLFIMNHSLVLFQSVLPPPVKISDQYYLLDFIHSRFFSWYEWSPLSSINVVIFAFAVLLWGNMNKPTCHLDAVVLYGCI